MTSFLPRFASLGLVATAAVASLTLAGAPAEARTNGFFSVSYTHLTLPTNPRV